MRRLRAPLALLMAGWYLCSAFGAVWDVVEVVKPRMKAVASADFPCAHHGCGCGTAEQCRLHCCCAPRTHAYAKPAAVRVTRLAVAQCAGHPDTSEVTNVPRLDPHLPVPTATSCANQFVRSPARVTPTPLQRLAADPPEKVPLPLLS